MSNILYRPEFRLEHYRNGVLIGERSTPNLMTKWGALHYVEFGVAWQNQRFHIEYPAFPQGRHNHYTGLISGAGTPDLDILDDTTTHAWTEFEDYFGFFATDDGRGGDGGGEEPGGGHQATFNITAGGTVAGAFITLTRSGIDVEDIFHEGVFTHSTPPSPGVPSSRPADGPGGYGAAGPVVVEDGDILRTFYEVQVWNTANFPSPDPVIFTPETDQGAPGP